MTREELKKSLHLTDEEVDELLAYDEDVDKNRPTKYDLDKEHMKVAKEMMKLDPFAAKKVPKSTKRGRKPAKTC